MGISFLTAEIVTFIMSQASLLAKTIRALAALVNQSQQEGRSRPQGSCSSPGGRPAASAPAGVHALCPFCLDAHRRALEMPWVSLSVEL